MTVTPNYLWVDDRRDPAEFGYAGALWVRDPQTAIQILKDNPGFFHEMSLDHDMGFTEGNDGYAIILYLEESGAWPEGGVRVHSSNTAARDRMLVPIRAHYGRDFQWGLD